MHLHYFTLLRIVRLLNEQAAGSVVAEVFTQDKDELVIGLGKPGGDLWLRVSCAPQLTFVWPVSQFNKAGRNVANLFPETIGKVLLRAEALPWERVLVLHLEDDTQLILKMHGNHSNVLLRIGGQIDALFRNQLDVDLSWQQPAPSARLELADVEQVEDVAAHLKAISPALDRRFAERTRRAMQSGKNFRDAFAEVCAEAAGERTWIHRTEGKIEFLVVSPPDADALKIMGVQEGLLAFFRNTLHYRQYHRNFTAAEKALQSELARVQGQIASYHTSLANLDGSRSAEELGSILMAFMHEVPAGAKEVTLQDFYLGGEVRIKLDPRLNAQQNAERLFLRQKDRKKQKQHLTELIAEFEEELNQLQPCAETFAALLRPEQLTLSVKGIDHTHAKAMAAFVKNYGDLLNLGSNGSKERKNFFFEYEKEGWKILVGRNSRNNDELTFAHSHKEDLWLHARDVPGSHVILQRKGKDFPKHIVEFAASIAAHYSKRKGEALVPVQYTLRKYVRKLRGGAPGQVTLEREQVLLVEPMRKA